MKIVIDLTQLSDNLSGLERYAMNITREMILADKENQYVLLYKNRPCEHLTDLHARSNVSIRVYRGKHKLLFNQVQLPFYLYREKKADKYLFLAFPCPLLFRKKGIYTLIADLTCWDCPQTMKTKAKIYFRATLRHSVRVSEKLITISEFSKQRILQKFGGEKKESEKYRKLERSIILAYCAVGEAFVNGKTDSIEQKKAIREKYHLPDEYFLCLSTLEPRKNLPLLIRAYGRLLREQKEGALKLQDVPSLVLAGRKGWMIDSFLQDIQKDYPGKVIVTGFVEDADLPCLYSMAKCFIFPSLYEGFGMPPLEALAVGTPVISSDAASMPEVLGEHAIYFASQDEDDLLTCMIAFLKSAPERIPYTNPVFDWKRSAESIMQHFKKTVKAT